MNQPSSLDIRWLGPVLFALGLLGCTADGTNDGEAALSTPPAVSPSPTSTVDEIEDLEAVTCFAFNSGEGALLTGDVDTAFSAAQLLEELAGQWEETTPALGQTLRDLGRGLRGSGTDRAVLADLRRIRERNFPSCVSAGVPEEPVGGLQTFADGTWVVSEDVKPGIYRNAAPSSGCYWERMRNFSGGLNSIIANGLETGGPIVVEILKSDRGFMSQDCGDWTSDLSRVSADRTRITDGIWIVGVDVQPGTYRLANPGNNCYWERMRDFSQGLKSILANGLPTGGSAIVEIRSSDAGFTSTGCGTWQRV